MGTNLGTIQGPEMLLTVPLITQKFVVTMFVSSMVELNGKGKILEFILDSTSKL